MKNKKRLLSALLAACMSFSVFSAGFPAVNAANQTNEIVGANSYGLPSNIQDGTILHCFDWKYNDIKAELKNIAEAGFTAIQTSPAQQGAGSGVWWWLYQPLGFSVQTNGLGSKSELQSLCTEAEKYGIKVVVDVVANHLAGDHSNIDNDLKNGQYWHTHGKVNSWQNRWEVTHGEIGMPDIATENSYVQQRVKNYISELKSIGVDGIRFDAAKHIGLPSEGDGFWSTVTSDKNLWYYGEILGGPDDRKSGNEGLMREYTNYISVTDSDYGKLLREAFNSGNAPYAYGNWSAKGVDNNKLVYWGESHDTWSNNKDWGYSNDMSQNVIDRAYAIAASRNDISALYFSRPASKVKDSIMIGQKGSTHFSSPEVAAINHFHNAMIGQKDYFVNSNGCAVVSREKGAVVVKGNGSGQVTVENGGSTTAPGTYVDEITGNKWTVTSSTISGTIGSSGIAVIYNPKPASPSASINPGSKSYKTDTLTLTLNYQNATSGSYSINGGAYTNFTNGQTITIGKNESYGTNTSVSVKASNGNETSSAETYTYTKVDPSQSQRVYFNNSAYNWSDVYAYIYTGSGSSASEVSAWPGTKMKRDTNTGYYVLEIPGGYENGNIIFTESMNATSHRYPADQEPGLPLEGTTKLFDANHSFKMYNPPVPTQPTTVPPTTQPSNELKVTAVSNVFPQATKSFNKNDKTVTVSYKLSSNMKVENSQWVLTYDSSKLSFSKEKNSQNGIQTITPTVGESLYYKQSNGKIKGVFTSLNLFDFSKTSSFVTVTFDIIGSGSTEIALEMEYLSLGYKNSKGELFDAPIVKYGSMQDISDINGFENAKINTSTSFDFEVLLIGDADESGNINIDDTVYIQKYLVDIMPFSSNQIKASDTDGDGRVSVIDATKIQLYLAGHLDSCGNCGKYV